MRDYPVTKYREDPTRDYYSFVGWSTSKTEYVSYDFSTILNANKTLYAYWKGNSYTITYENVPNGYKTSDPYTYPNVTVAPTNPTKDGYTFSHWTVKGTTTKFTFGSALNENKTLVSNWTEWKGTVVYNFLLKGEDDPTPQTKEITYTGKIENLARGAKEGYTPTGWYYDKACTRPVDFTTASKVANGGTINVYCNYVENQTNLTWHYNDKDKADETKTYGYHDKITPMQHSKEGYTFGGWYTDTKCTKAFDFNGKVKTTKDLYAKWTENMSTLKFNSNGGSVVADQTKKYSENTTEPAAPTKVGFTFDSWYTDNGTFANKFVFGKPIKNGGVVYANWIEKDGVMTFDTDGGSVVVSQTLKYHTAPTKPSDPTKTGYTFGGWYTTKAFTTEFDFTKSIENGKTAYAKWIDVYGTLVFNTNGGSAVGNQIRKYWENTTEPTEPTRIGYTFGGWYTDNETFANKFVFGEPIENGSVVYAKWTQNDADLVFVSNGGSNVETQKLKYWDKTTEPINPTKDGFTFDGWFTDNGTFNNRFVFGEYIKNGNTVYAKWTENTGVMSFNTDGGNPIASQTKRYWETPDRPADPTKEGFTFDDWYISQTSTTKFDFTQFIKTGKTAYAKWIENNGTLVFKENGGSAVEDQTLSYWTNTTEPESPTKEGRTFGGWYTDNGTFNNKFVFGQPIKTGNTVYAKWIDNPSRMEYITNGGTAVPAENLTYWDKPTKPADPTKQGFTFKGWFKTNDFDEEFNFNDKVKTGAKAYAKWEEKSSTIKFDSGEGSSVEEQRVLYWSNPAIPEEPTRDGYTFDGWYTTEDFDELFDFEKEMKGRTVTVYANWLRISIVKFETNGGSKIDDQKVLYGDLVVKPENPSRYNYNFVGWFKDVSLREAFDFETDILNGNDITLYARWKEVEHPAPSNEPEAIDEPSKEPSEEPNPTPTTPTPIATPTVKPTDAPTVNSTVMLSIKPSSKPVEETQTTDDPTGNTGNESYTGDSSNTTPTISPDVAPTIKPTTEVVENRVIKDSFVIKVKNFFKAILNIFKHVGWYWWIIIVIILIIFVIIHTKKKIDRRRSEYNIDKNDEINVKKTIKVN